jgi:hypothetical protein
MGVLATWQLAKANRQSMNIEGSFQHILTDLIAFIATAIASAVILATDWTRADGAAALLLLHERFAIDHTTLQVDHAPEPGLVRIGATPTTRHEH